MTKKANITMMKKANIKIWMIYLEESPFMPDLEENPSISVSEDVSEKLIKDLQSLEQFPRIKITDIENSVIWKS